MIFRNS